MKSLIALALLAVAYAATPENRFRGYSPHHHHHGGYRKWGGYHSKKHHGHRHYDNNDDSQCEMSSECPLSKLEKLRKIDFMTNTCDPSEEITCDPDVIHGPNH